MSEPKLTYSEDSSGFEASRMNDLALRQQEFEFAERRARVILEAADRFGSTAVTPEIVAQVIKELMEAGR